MDKISKRSIFRIQAMKILFIADTNKISISEALKNAKSGILNDDEINENIEIDESVESLVNYVDENLAKIDELISSTLVNYTIGRLNGVDKAIVRVAVAEMLAGNLDNKIIINEALEITKLYSDTGDHKAVGFNNRLLDNISKKI